MRMRRESWVMALSSLHITISSFRHVGITECGNKSDAVSNFVKTLADFFIVNKWVRTYIRGEGLVMLGLLAGYHPVVIRSTKS
jgi:hypothetical protein